MRGGPYLGLLQDSGAYDSLTTVPEGTPSASATASLSSYLVLSPEGTCRFWECRAGNIVQVVGTEKAEEIVVPSRPCT